VSLRHGKGRFPSEIPIEWLGVMYISSMLKSHGHECRVYVEPFEKDDVAKRAVEDGNDIVAFACLTIDYTWALCKARTIKEISHAPLIVFGGTHVTLNPESVFSVRGGRRLPGRGRACHGGVGGCRGSKSGFQPHS